ncbi:hypothetical protein BGZ96_005974 [Linnemannia gamsii]|uniref:Phytocyanin domain-containing protein n=1 Tax=Linnemannia gamsii TaxID=64522 RepID=A0ABQ7K3U0_9FUNG|nr:hypothetical protein BGZ96_005974 [Linnemannia gamsii]
MRFDITVLAVVALIAPSVFAKTWNVTESNNQFTPQELDIAPGDTVSWTSTTGTYAIVETNDGPRSCVSKSGGFNSGTKDQGVAYSRIFPAAAVVNYKDGVSSNCANGAMGTVFVGPRPAGTNPNNGTSTSSGTAGPTSSGSTGTSPTGSQTATSSTNPTSTTQPNSAYGLIASENALFFGAICFIGALVGL